jgi:hypothetical protein
MEKRGYEKLSKVASTKLKADEYKLCQEIAKAYYFKAIIKMPSISELPRFALHEIFKNYSSSTAVDNKVNQEKLPKIRQGWTTKFENLIKLPDLDISSLDEIPIK